MVFTSLFANVAPADAGVPLTGRGGKQLGQVRTVSVKRDPEQG